MEIDQANLLDTLRNHIGARKGASAVALATECLGRTPQPCEIRNMRRVIQALREDGHHICGTPATGYYIAATPEELDATCEFLHERAMCSLKQVARMRKVSVPDLRGQLRLPT